MVVVVVITVCDMLADNKKIRCLTPAGCGLRRVHQLRFSGVCSLLCTARLWARGWVRFSLGVGLVRKQKRDFVPFSHVLCFHRISGQCE